MVYVNAKPSSSFHHFNKITMGGLLNHDAPSMADLAMDRKPSKAFCDCLKGLSFYRVKDLGTAVSIAAPKDGKCDRCGHFVFWSNEFSRINEKDLTMKMVQSMNKWKDRNQDYESR